MKRYYLKVHPQTNVILDCIEYEYGNYIPFDTEFIPPDILGGWYKFEEGRVVEYPELKPKAPAEEELENLKIELSQTNATLDSILTEAIPSLMALIQ